MAGRWRQPETFGEVFGDLSRTALEWRDHLQQLPILPTPAGESFSGAVDEHLQELGHSCKELRMRTMQSDMLQENLSVYCELIGEVILEISHLLEEDLAHQSTSRDDAFTSRINIMTEVLNTLREHAGYDSVEWYFKALKEEVHWNQQEEACLPHLRKLLRDAYGKRLDAADRDLEESNARITDRLDKISEQVAALTERVAALAEQVAIIADKSSRPSRFSRFLRRFSRR